MTDPESWVVLRAQSGDRAALETLLAAVQPVLHRYLRGLIRDESLADDVLQETLFCIYRKLRWLDDPALFRRDRESRITPAATIDDRVSRRTSHDTPRISAGKTECLPLLAITRRRR